ncbi:metallophosphoesterase family protein [Shouchella shacheensis]|uniref:metallophosphoesterase family protein n=1 Tax=Shouchella shacheensis TaxID=1649580 RepID=UPI00073FB748|nr:metallophosphoesterase [Shouchella shacheensis]
MRFLVLSDSHGWFDEVEEIIARHREEVEQVIHVGDSELKADAPPLADALVVQGNCDLGEDFEAELTPIWYGKKLLITHGHHYDVKMTLQSLLYRAEELGAKIAIFGHTHVATAVKEHGVVLLNPGSVRLPNGRREGTYCVCELNKEELNVAFYTTAGEFVSDLSGVVSLS